MNGQAGRTRMDTVQTQLHATWEERAARERDRLVRLCATLSGSLDVAEDLAQETLVEAWRHRAKLHDPSGDAQWLSQIARYVCLRWRRRQSHEARLRQATEGSADGRFAGLVDVADETDFTLDLERHQLAELLDRALALLDPPTHALLIQHYVDGLTQAELARHLGLTEGAIAVRLHRGRLVLKRALLTDLQPDAQAYGLVKLGSGSWHETDAWCTFCGACRLHARWTATPAPGWLTLRCPVCFQFDGLTFHDSPLAHALSPQLIQEAGSYQAVIQTIGQWVHSFFRPHLAHREVPCPDCGRPATLNFHLPDDLPLRVRRRRGVYFTCDACERTTTQGFEGLATALPEARAFALAHPRIRTLPERQIESEGQPAVVTIFESVPDGHRLAIVSARDSYRLLAIHGAPQLTPLSTI